MIIDQRPSRLPSTAGDADGDSLRGDGTAAEKRRLRSQALARRARAFAADPDAGTRLFARLQAIGLPQDAVVAGYWPLRDELDPRPAMLALLGLGHALCLPVVVGPAQPLLFRAWTPETTLEAAGFGTRVPGPEAPERVPSVLLVPLVAFDDEGCRLGYGGGFYDRTLARLRASRPPAGPVLAVGVAYAAQRVPQLPREATDEPLDWIVTEADAERFCRGRSQER